ncbi:MAG: hypothetical protein U1F66_10125 [bacterium]
MSVANKIANLNQYLNLALRASEPSRASKNLEMAEMLLAEVERLTLSNPFLDEAQLAHVVSVTRSRQWTQVRNHIDNLYQGQAA